MGMIIIYSCITPAARMSRKCYYWRAKAGAAVVAD